MFKLLEEINTRPKPFEFYTAEELWADEHTSKIQHRLVYQVLEKERVVKVLRIWTHYE